MLIHIAATTEHNVARFYSVARQSLDIFSGDSWNAFEKEAIVFDVLRHDRRNANANIIRCMQLAAEWTCLDKAAVSAYISQSRFFPVSGDVFKEFMLWHSTFFCNGKFCRALEILWNLWYIMVASGRNSAPCRVSAQLRLGNPISVAKSGNAFSRLAKSRRLWRLAPSCTGWRIGLARWVSFLASSQAAANSPESSSPTAHSPQTARPASLSTASSFPLRQENQNRV